ncbi:MAG: hypothetical protein WBM14_13640 [Terracidiphilus sp.]
MDEGETIDVELELVDCDGVQLKNCTVHLLAGQWETLGASKARRAAKCNLLWW